MSVFIAFVAGLVFGLGLLVAGMADPGKILGFLDLAGLWNPSLVFVMIGAIAVTAIAFALAKRRSVSLLGAPMYLPTERRLDRRLLLGSVLFGVGWGLAGICPGPALVLIGAGMAKGITFTGAMLAGMGLFEWLERRRFGARSREQSGAAT